MSSRQSLGEAMVGVDVVRGNGTGDADLEAAIGDGEKLAAYLAL